MSDREKTQSGGTDEVVLDVNNLTVEFDTEMGVVHALQNVSFTLNRGETVAVVGESGSGKTTMISAILGLLAGNARVTSGEVLFQGQDTAHLPEAQMRKIRGIHMGLVPQDPMSNLNPVLRVGDQVGEVLLTHKKATKANVKEKVVDILGKAGLPDAASRTRQYPHEFSGGMRQRVLIGIGLSCDPEILIADEPTSALDVTVQRQILDHLEKMTTDLGTAMILITHDLGLAAERARRVIVMYKGNIVEQGNAAEILRNPQHEYTKKLVASAPSIASARLQTSVSERAQEVQALESEVFLRVQGLRKEFRVRDAVTGKRSDFRAVDDVDFTLHRGSTLAIVGESGSGKSTTARMVLRLDQPTAGSIDFNGQDISQLKGRRLKSLRRLVQPIFQDPYASLNPTASIGEVLEEPLKVYGVGNRASRRKKAYELLDLVSLDRSMYDRFPQELSGGQRQRIAIARALTLDPELIICDEPVSALDVLVQAQILDLLNDLQGELGLSYLFISHDLAVVQMIADEVLVMRHGKILERGVTSDVFANPQHEYTQRLIEAIPGREHASDAASVLVPN